MKGIFGCNENGENMNEKNAKKMQRKDYVAFDKTLTLCWKTASYILDLAIAKTS